MPLGFGSICPSLRRGGADRFDEDREGSGFAFVESFTNRVSLGCAYSIETDLSCCWVLWSKNSLVTSRQGIRRTTSYYPCGVSAFGSMGFKDPGPSGWRAVNQ